MNKNRDMMMLLLKVLTSTAVAAVILLLASGMVNWLHVLHNEPEQGETIRHYFLRCWLVSSCGEAIQILVLLIAASILAIVRRQHSVVVGVLGGVVLFLLDVVAITMGLQHRNMATATLVYFGLPMIVSGLQLCARRKNGKASNKASEDTSL